MLLSASTIVVVLLLAASLPLVVPRLAPFGEVLAFVRRNRDEPVGIVAPCALIDFDRTDAGKMLLSFWYAYDLEQRMRIGLAEFNTNAFYFCSIKTIFFLGLAAKPALADGFWPVIYYPFLEVILLLILGIRLYIYAGEWSRYRSLSTSRAVVED